jgi:hypothetical protein
MTIFSWLGRVTLATALVGAAAIARGEELPRPLAVSTGFDVARDGLPFANNGDFASPNGNCWGMSLLAIDNFLRRPRERAAVTPPPPTASFPHEADPRAQATASLAQAAARERDWRRASDRPPLDRPASVLAALERMRASGVPEVLVIEGPKYAHAVVVHGYRDGALRVYDPNFPGEELAWPWDPVRGFGKHPKAVKGDFYDTLSGATSIPFDDHTTGKAMAALREACAKQADECVGRYPSLRVELSRTEEDVVVLIGQAAPAGPGGEMPTQVWVAIDGVPIGAAEVGRFGTFRAVIPRVALRDVNRIRVIGQVRTTSGTPQFAGFAEVDLPRPGPRPRPPKPPAQPSRTRGLTGALGGGR